jgi:hypothetical protein
MVVYIACEALEDLAVDGLQQKEAGNLELAFLSLLEPDYEAHRLIPRRLVLHEVVHLPEPEVGSTRLRYLTTCSKRPRSVLCPRKAGRNLNEWACSVVYRFRILSTTL